MSTRYVRKPVPVEAIQWHGEANCQAVFDFIGWEHSDDELDHSVIHLDNDQEAKPGDWIVRDPWGDVHAVNPDRFAAVYEQATPSSDDEPDFGGEGCTCRPFTHKDGSRYLDQPGDTVDMISGWEIGDCPHHKRRTAPAVGEQADA